MSQPHKEHHGSEHERHDHYDKHSEHDHEEHDHSSHHAHMIEDFKRRFWISLAVTIPVLVLSPMIQGILNYQVDIPYSGYILFVLSTFIFFYGGWPFISGLFSELKKKEPIEMLHGKTFNTDLNAGLSE